MTGTIALALRLLLTLALYAFLGWTTWVLWSDLKRAAHQAESTRIPSIRIEVRTKKRGAVSRAFSQPEIILGRDPSCDLPLDDETVSASHARLRYHHKQWWLEDLQSTNGTRLNGQKVTTATVLASGDEVRCGKAKLVILLESEVLPLNPQNPSEAS